MSLTNLSIAKWALEEAKTFSEVLEVRDKATAILSYANAKGADEASQMALEIKLRAERKAGIFLKEDERVSKGKSSILPHLGINRTESSRWQRMASIPDDKFEEFINKSGGSTQSAILAEAKRQSLEIYEPVETPSLPEGVYNVLLADPPWRYQFSRSTVDSIPAHYPDMDLQDICDMEIPSSDDSILFLWATNPKLKEAIQVLESWGFTYKTNLVWVKNRIGQGYWFRGQHELLLVGVKGNFPTPKPTTRRSGVLEADYTGHSSKPHKVYEIIESYFPDGKYLELFSRNKRLGWTMWGADFS